MYVYALNPATGAVSWTSPRLGNAPNQVLFDTPTLFNGSIYIGLASNGDCPQVVQGDLFQLNATTGALQDTFYTVSSACSTAQFGYGGGGIWGSLTIDESAGTLYFADGNTEADGCPYAETPYAQAVVELSSNLSVVSSWQLQDPVGEDHDFGATPTLFSGPDGTPMVGVVNKNGTFYAFDRGGLTSGPVWSRQIAVDSGQSCPQCGDGSVAPGAWDATTSTLYIAGGTPVSTARARERSRGRRAFWRRSTPRRTRRASPGRNA